MPKIVDQDARREEVLSATWRAILKGGLGGATMRAIAAEAGTSTGTVNHYFADKEAILLAALRLNQQRTIARLKATVETSEPGLAALRVLVEAALPLDEDRRASWIVWQTFEAEQRSGYLSWRELFRDRRRPRHAGCCAPRSPQ